MPKTTVYLAGKMTGLTYEEMMEWRIHAENFLRIPDTGESKFRIINPVDTDFGTTPSKREMVHSNKFQISNSDIVLAELNHEEVSIGTLFEIAYANEKGKPVIVWGKNKKIIDHLWVEESITKAFDTLFDACVYIRRNYYK